VFIAAEATQVGAIYGVNMSDDNLYVINRLTGAATLIGSTGLALSYGQDISWDSNTSTLYGMLYDETQGGVFGTFDTGTGTFTTISVPGEQIAAFAVNNAWTGISEIGNYSAFFHPNPASDFITLTVNDFDHITISDLSGRTVFQTTDNQSKMINISSFEAGVYIISIFSKNEVSSGKLIIR
jgi:hypothetical protein